MVQKYIINKLVKKRRNCKPSWSVYSMFICYFLKQPLHNYGVYKMAEKEERRRSLRCMTRNIRINYCTKHSTWFLCQVTGESRPGLGMTGQHTLQHPSTTKHLECKGKNPSLLDGIVPRSGNKDIKTPCHHYVGS